MKHFWERQQCVDSPKMRGMKLKHFWIIIHQVCLVQVIRRKNEYISNRRLPKKMQTQFFTYICHNFKKSRSEVLHHYQRALMVLHVTTQEGSLFCEATMKNEDKLDMCGRNFNAVCFEWIFQFGDNDQNNENFNVLLHWEK